MTTWTSKTCGAVLGLLTLTACDAVPDLPVLGALTAPDDATAAPVALSQTKMANGAFTLIPPDGFCIDKSSLKQRFALLARCDTLGVADGAAGAPLGVMTVSAAPQGRAESAPVPEETADALKLARVADARAQDGTVTFRAEGTPPIADLDVKHWRGTLLIEGQIISLALFGPKDGRALSEEGRALLNTLMRRTKKASAS